MKKLSFNIIKYGLYLLCFSLAPVWATELHTVPILQIRQETDPHLFKLAPDDFSNWKNEFFTIPEKESDAYRLIHNKDIPVDQLVNKLNAFAESGDNCAARVLAGLYLQAEQVDYNRLEAFKILRRAAKQGDSISKRIIGQMLLDPQYIDYSPQTAFSYLQEAKKAGDQEAAVFLSVMNILGLHQKGKTETGIQELKELSKKGLSLARMYLLLTERAFLMQEGKDTADMDRAMVQFAAPSPRLTYIAALNQQGEYYDECIERLVKAKHPLGIILKAKTYMADGDWNQGAFMMSKPPVDRIPEAQSQMGSFLFLCFMEQPDPDLKEHLGKEFFSVLQSAASQHHRKAEYKLASFLLATGPSFIQNCSVQEKLKLADILRREALTGDAEAMNNYGYQYLIGFYTRKDLKEGEKWLWKAVQKNYMNAFTNLAILYAGEFNDGADESIPVNYAKSIELLERAKKLGDPDAQEGINYFKGLSLKQKKLPL